ncbi:VanZ family protein [Corynebacterium wankanglinii]|nr:VanZ family protein [Corynebacterium wankanglinii]
MTSASNTETKTARAAAAVITCLVVLAFTVGKAFVSIPGLWSAESHQLSQIRLNPLETFEYARVWWGPWLNLFGNIALFLPVGFVAYRGAVGRAVLVGLLCSLGIETAQYLCSWGYSDADDVICNTAGAWLGAGGPEGRREAIAQRSCGRLWRRARSSSPCGRR